MTSPVVSGDAGHHDGGDGADDHPLRVRIIVLTHAGASLLPGALHALQRSFGADDLSGVEIDLVVVDNASADGSGEVARAGGARVRRSDVNVGFSANNLELNPDEADVFVLLNDDVRVGETWLTPLLDALRQPGVGAVQPTMLFEGTWVRVDLGSAAVGRRLLSVDLDGLACSTVQPISGLGVAESGGRMVGADAAVWCAVSDAAAGGPVAPRRATLRTDQGDIDVDIVSGPPVALVQNAGIELLADGRGKDRLAWTPAAALPEAPTSIFATCGGAMAMSSSFLRDVGGFEPSLFLYYEDLDLGWRGAKRGWQYLHVPRSQVIHPQGATVGGASPLHRHWTLRNRLVVLTRNAPWSLVLRGWSDELRALAWHGRRRAGLTSGVPSEFAPRARALAAVAVATPTAVMARRRLRKAARNRPART